MARGFWTGLVHGGVLSAAALAVVSLVTPLSESQPVPAAVPDAPAEPAVIAPTPEPLPDAVTPEPAAPPAGVPEPAAVSVNSGPDAAAVDLPVGSEFGRGDVAPVLPAPLTVPEGRSVSEAPAVSAPAAEPSPVTVTASDPRPEAQISTDGPDRAEPAQADAVPVLDLPAPQAAPRAAAVPDMGMAGQADLSPLLPDISQDDGPQPDAEPTISPIPVAQAPVEPAPTPNPATELPPNSTPRAANAPDLSLPPSIADFGVRAGD